MAKNEKPQEINADYIEDRYNDQIKYYWKKSTSNKNYYKQSRFWIITLGALVTLVSSLSAADFIQKNEVWRVIFAITTPIIAATLTLLNGLTQTFHWGATWRDMVVSATHLEKERDLMVTTPKNKRDFQKELDNLNSIVLSETKSFFARVLDSEVKPKDEE
ncbi:MAG TPA: DUF4231 domain-containing protein [Anaerolineales bacterium]|nr:DUF4231 domain-containing protein [Anaerolineales bacterium]